MTENPNQAPNDSKPSMTATSQPNSKQLEYLMIQEQNKEQRLRNLALARNKLAEERRVKKERVTLEPLPVLNSEGLREATGINGNARQMLSLAQGVKRKIAEVQEEKEELIQEVVAKKAKKNEHPGIIPSRFTSAIRGAFISTVLTVGGLAFSAMLPSISSFAVDSLSACLGNGVKSEKIEEGKEVTPKYDIFRT